MKKISKFIKKNMTVSLISATFIILILVMTVFWIAKKGTFSVEDDNRLVLDCDEVFISGHVVECNVSLVVKDNTKKYSVNALYDFDEGITYNSFGVDNTECSGEGCFELLSDDNNLGFAVVNISGVTEGMLIGKLRVNMPEDVVPNHQYKIGLKEIELSYDENGEVSDNMLELSDVFVNSRAANDVSTLSSISLGETELTESSSSTEYVKKYDATVSSDVTQVTLNYTLTDENASVSGSGVAGDLSLHYGNNMYYLTVTSENGSVATRYEVNIRRQYVFSSEVYEYNADQNYIYTKWDVGEAIINNIDQLEENLHYELRANNKLAIVYGEDDDLLVLDIVNFTSEYEIIDNKLYVDNNLTSGQLLEAFTANNITIKLFDNSNNEVTDMTTNIQNNYKLNIYYGTNLLDSFTVDLNYLRISDSLSVDNQKMLIKRLDLGATYGEFKQNFDTNGTITFISNLDDSIMSDDDIIKTNDIVRIVIGSDTVEYTLSVLGDMNGDGILKLNDVGRLYRYVRGKQVLTAAEEDAGNIIVDGVTKLNDVGRLYRYLRGKVNPLEVVD